VTNPAPGFTKHPNYQVEILPLEGELSVCAGDHEIARSQRAVIVRETKHRDVWYMPFDDLDPASVTPSSTDTYCPFKGHASYWSVTTGNQTIEDAIWAYMAPYDECAAIKGYASFYTNKVDLYINGELTNKDGPGWTETSSSA
jgi:uncharacterized protein (DUF427 family)